ncbi:ABC-type multidrug transport system permease subunit [Kibdelosporangium banguiense]|uniref:ABC-type multidrug transport system permease subunit n=1 Tax=Kibdelosporangium banguiense TaxID=1365924 RepID=A0ABS4TJ10_9PSEU|nr:ABC transporter permease [Kibdelosporangium banguiense]MBP2323888.1 ABC-type multidrug transport system permease subunit [Kibdelosporangium banguiense]
MTAKALVAGLIGALVAAVLGLLTFGAQATVDPDHLPLAVEAPPGPMSQLAQRVASQGGEHVEWHVVPPGEGSRLLEDKEVYGVLQLGQPVKVLLSGAINPGGTQVTQQVLTGAAQTLAASIPDGAPPQTITLHPASAAGRVAPLAGSALLWIAGLAAGLLFVALRTRTGVKPGIAARITLPLTASVLSVGVVALLLLLWDSSLDLGWDVLGFMLLAALAFTGVQGALLKLLGLRAAAILGPLYLIAPAVAGQVPEMLHPFYRDILWSWTPFRFAAEGTRSLLQGTGSAPDVWTGVIVLGSMAVVGLLVILLPGKRISAGQETEPDRPSGVVHVGVH